MEIPTDRVNKIKNRVDKDKALGAKSPAMFKEVIKKYPFGFNLFEYL